MNRRGLAKHKVMHMHNSQNNLLPPAHSQLLRRSISLGALSKLGQRTTGPRTQINRKPIPKNMIRGGTLV